MPKQAVVDEATAQALKKALAGLPEDALLMPEEAAFLLRITVGTLADDRNSGSIGIPFVKLGGGVIRYQREAIRKVVESQTFTNTAEAKFAERARREDRLEKPARGRKLGLMASSYSDFISSNLEAKIIWPFTFTGPDQVPEEFFSTIGRAKAEDRREHLSKTQYLAEIERATNQRATREAKEADIDPVVKPLLAKAPSKPREGV